MIFIKNGKIVTKDGTVLENNSILIDNSKIVDIGAKIKCPTNAEVIDANNNFVFPGFIDAHTHLGMKEDSIGFEGDDLNEKTDPVTPHLRAIDAINPMDKGFMEAYKSGVTCVASGPGSSNVLGGQFVAIKTYGKRIDNMIVKNPVAMKCAFGENPKRCYNSKNKTPITRMAIAALLRETLMKAKEYDDKIKKSKNIGLNTPNFDMKLDALLSVIHGEIPLKAHAHKAEDIFTAIRIAKEFNVKLTLDHCTEGDLIVEELKKEKFDAIVGPSLGSRGKVELKNKCFETAGILSNNGIKVAITTDNPVIPIQHLSMCAALAVKSGMDKIEALKAITINAAEILNIQNRVGSIEIGKDADIVIWNGSPFNIESRVIYTIINGNIVYKNELAI